MIRDNFNTSMKNKGLALMAIVLWEYPSKNIDRRIISRQPNRPVKSNLICQLRKLRFPLKRKSHGEERREKIFDILKVYGTMILLRSEDISENYVTKNSQTFKPAPRSLMPFSRLFMKTKPTPKPTKRCNTHIMVVEWMDAISVFLDVY